MLLGLSSLSDGEGSSDGFEITAVASSENGDGGVTGGAILTRYAEAVHEAGAGHEVDLDAITAEVIEKVGEAGLVDAAAICANFNMMVRIADGTGTPLDEGTIDVSAELRQDLNLDSLTSRRLATATEANRS